jgi:pseudaminic acid cytidylyltransferase
VRIAVIPARGGSKRIPRKNIRDFCGKPVIAWSIEAAQRSACFDQVIVSTDDDEIAGLARGLGAVVPFVRPAKLSGDHIGTTDVIRHAIDFLNSCSDRTVEHACCIYATAPFVTSEDILEGLQILLSKECDYVFTVTSYAYPIQRALRITRQGQVEMFNPEYIESRSQDLEDAYHDAGQFYWGRAEAWLSESPIFSPGAVPLILPRYRVQDIDTPEDWTQAEKMYNVLHQDYTSPTAGGDE